MGLIDEIAERASDKIAEHVKGQSSSAPDIPPTAAPPDPTKLKGIPMGPMTAETEAKKAIGNQGNTNPAYNEMGLKETDVAPGGPPPAAPVNPPVQPVAIPAPQTVQAGTTPSAPPVTPAPPVVVGKKAADPVKDAASTPGFWDQVMNVAKNTGKNLFELLGDFAAGYSHQSTPTQQRLAREHELRLQGNQLQASKDLMSLNQGFQNQQNQLDREFQGKLAATTDANVKQQLQQQYEYQRGELANQRLLAMNSYYWTALMTRMGIGSQTSKTGGVAGLFGE